MNQTSIEITVRLFAGAAEVVGKRTLQLQLPCGADVRTAKSRLLTQYPQLEPLSRVSLWASATELLTDDTKLLPDSELAMIPPVSGG